MSVGEVAGVIRVTVIVGQRGYRGNRSQRLQGLQGTVIVGQRGYRGHRGHKGHRAQGARSPQAAWYCNTKASSTVPFAQPLLCCAFTPKTRSSARQQLLPPNSSAWHDYTIRPCSQKGSSSSTHLVSELALMLKNVALMLLAMALPISVLPVPGGPKRSRPRGGERAPVNSPGFSIGQTTISCKGEQGWEMG